MAADDERIVLGLYELWKLLIKFGIILVPNHDNLDVFREIIDLIESDNDRENFLHAIHVVSSVLCAISRYTYYEKCSPTEDLKRVINGFAFSLLEFGTRIARSEIIDFDFLNHTQIIHGRINPDNVDVHGWGNMPRSDEQKMKDEYLKKMISRWYKHFMVVLGRVYGVHIGNLNITIYGDEGVESYQVLEVSADGQ